MCYKNWYFEVKKFSTRDDSVCGGVHLKDFKDL